MERWSGIMRRVLNGITCILILLLAACGEESLGETSPHADPTPIATQHAPSTAATSTEPSPRPTEQRYPDIIDVQLTRNEDGTFDFAVTVSSPYDTPERYADAWRVVAPDGNVLAERELLHDHANEQPFTRTLANVTIPDDITIVTVEGRDQEYGYGGQTMQVTIPPP